MNPLPSRGAPTDTTDTARTGEARVTAGARALGVGLLGSAALIGALTLLARVAGLGRTLVFAPTVFSGCVGTAYTTANTLPNVLFEVAAGGALAGAVVPTVSAALARGRQEEVDRTVSALLTWCLLVLLPLGLLVALVADPLAGLLLGGRQECPHTRALAGTMLALFAPQIPLYGIGIVCGGVLQAHRRFVGPALAPLMSSLVVVASYLAYAAVAGPTRADPGFRADTTARLVLAGGTTLGVVALSLPLLWPVRRLGVRLRPRLAFPPGQAAAVRALAVAGLGALLAQQACVVVTMSLANHVGGEGPWPVLQYAQAFYLLPYAVLAVPLSTAVFPVLSRHVAEGEHLRFARTAAGSTRVVILVSCLGAGGLVALAPAAQGLFTALERGRGGPVHLLGAALSVMAPGLLGWALVAHLGRVLYAQGRGRAAATATAWGWGAAALVTVAAVLGLDSAVLGLDGAVSTGAEAVMVGSALGNTVGMGVAGTALLRALRSTAGPVALDGVPRALACGAAGAALVALAGRRVTDTVMGDVGGVWGVLAATVVTGLTGAVLFLGVVMIVDRRDLGALRWAGRGGARPERSTTGRDGVLLVLGTSSGGVGRHVQALAEGLHTAGLAVTVAGPDATRDRFALDATGADVVPVEISDRPRPWRDLRAVVRLRALLRQVEVVHAHGLRAGAVVVLAARSGPRRPGVVVTVHNAPAARGRAARVYRLLERVVARGADVVLVVSGDLGERARRAGARHVEHALVPAPPTACPPRTREEVRAELAVPEGTLLLVTVARLAPQKGLPVLADALDLLRHRHPDLPVCAVVAGDGPLRESLAADIEARDLPLRLLGRREDAPALMTAADAVVLPSLWEGQPLVAQEALRCGAVLVATDAGGTREVTGDAAVLVPPGDAPALADALAQVLRGRGPAAALRGSALSRAAALPDDAAALAQVRGVYEALGGGRPPRRRPGRR